ncbi:MAG: hypothetical protein H7834_05770 [Magnetococcus sp. YQC-9]
MKISMTAEPSVQQTRQHADPPARQPEIPFEVPDRPYPVLDRVTLSDPGVTRGRLVVPVLFTPHHMVERRIQGMVNDAMGAVLHQSVDLPESSRIRQEVVVKD